MRQRIIIYIALFLSIAAQACMPVQTTASSTVVPTTIPTSTHWTPAPKTSWQIQLQGEINTSIDADIYVIDLFDSPQSVIDALHAANRKVICYASAGSWEDWREDADQFPAEVIGEPLDDWPGEFWLDIRHSATRQVMLQRFDLAVEKRCDGVDMDNVDGYTQDTGFPLTADDQLDFNRFIATEAHQRNLAAGLKNDLGQIPQLVAEFDWVINEQCFAYDECALLQPFINAGKPVFNIEYEGDRAAICPQANALDFDTLFKTLDLRDEWFYCRGEVAASNAAYLPFLLAESR